MHIVQPHCCALHALPTLGETRCSVFNLLESELNAGLLHISGDVSPCSGVSPWTTPLIPEMSNAQ